MVKLAKGAKKQQGLKKKPPPPKEVEDEESSEEDSNEEETPPPKVVAKKSPKGLTAKNGKVAKKQESDDSEDESEEESQPPPKKGKATPAKVMPKKAAPVKAEESDDEDEDDDDEESEEETPPPKKATPAKAPTKATPAKAAPTPAKKVEEEDDDDDEDDDDEDESEEEVPPPKKATPAKPLAKTTPAKAAPTPAKKVEEEDDDEDEDDEEDDESEEEMDTAPAPVTKTKKAGMVKAKEESEEEEDDDEEDDDEEEDDDDEEEAAAVTPGKRKAESKKDTPPAKKPKSDNEGAFCLFVGNLNLDKDFDEIKDALSKFFTKKNLEVQSVRLGASKKFGYVDFASEEDLQKALELNGKKFMGQELKLDRARSKENSKEGRKERDARTLFVKNLPFSATQDDLKELFDQAVDIRIPLDNSGSGRGIAYVEFKTEAIAEKMLEEVQGADVQGRCIVVDFTGEKSQQKGGRAAPAAAGKTLVVNNLAYSVTEETLQSTFEKAVSIKVPQNNGRSKGFAFLDFETAEDAREAFDTMNNTEIEGRTVRLEFKQNSGSKFDGGRGNSGPTKTLFVRGLSEDTTDHTLRDSFEGAVAARIVTDRETGSSKGFGFVDFGNEEDCKAAKEAMEDCEIDGHKVTLDYARPKGDGGQRGGRGGFGGRGGGFGGRGGRGGFGGRGGGFRGGRGGGRGGFGGGRGGGFGAKPQGKKIKFDE